MAQASNQQLRKTLKIKGTPSVKGAAEAVIAAAAFERVWMDERDHGPEHGVVYTLDHIAALVYHTQEQTVVDPRGLTQPWQK